MSIIALKISSCILSFLKMGIWTSDIRYPSGKSQDSSPNLAPMPPHPSPPMSRPFLSHIFPSFQDPRPLTIVSLSDVCFFPTNQINWRPWTEIEGHWSGNVVSNEVLNSGSNWRERAKRAIRNILCFYPCMLLVPISNPHLHLYFSPIFSIPLIAQFSSNHLDDR